ncbi:ABC transporter substrate-binding protein [Aquimarina sp. U1-2]|uniref:ABC transporter substrate-binding protein n=1 Tax=Aquimarina sp. U1-2 TaxID=2823141 RepID=UPI001AECBC8E|nr:helical backbone metal receptor [Aquimarina sp. U1-2]MBP2833469.1 ABC transporter substrate-binding protein [Aquimarina sp. U1-2]
MMYIDQLQREVKLTKIPTRIVSLVPSQTELLVALGLEEAILGITKFCVHPSHLRKEKIVVGGTKKVNYEKIRSANPDIILCNKEENTKDIVEYLQEDFPVHVSNIFTINDALELIKQYGIIFTKENAAHQLVSQISKAQNSLVTAIARFKIKKVAYFIWKDPWIAVGNHTFINHVLHINRFINVFEHKDRYPEISLEEMKSLQEIDFILLSSEPYPFLEKHIAEVQRMNKKAKIILVDGEYFSWYGSRLVDAFSYFETLHKEISG